MAAPDIKDLEDRIMSLGYWLMLAKLPDHGFVPVSEELHFGEDFARQRYKYGKNTYELRFSEDDRILDDCVTFVATNIDDDRDCFVIALDTVTGSFRIGLN